MMPSRSRIVPTISARILSTTYRKSVPYGRTVSFRSMSRDTISCAVVKGQVPPRTRGLVSPQRHISLDDFISLSTSRWGMFRHVLPRSMPIQVLCSHAVPSIMNRVQLRDRISHEPQPDGKSLIF